MSDITAKASKIKLLLMDVDGVLTDGKLYNVPGPGGGIFETKAFDSQDGIALQWLSWYGIESGVISGRVSPATEERCRQCGCAHIYQGYLEKVPVLEEILAKTGIAPEETAYVGDDLVDVVLFRRVGLSIAVGNARPEVKCAADYVTSADGGRGAVREVCEMLMKAQGIWDKLLARYVLIG
ncbi:MAG: KdsC family phosphatase [bacterium]